MPLPQNQVIEITACAMIESSAANAEKSAYRMARNAGLDMVEADLLATQVGKSWKRAMDYRAGEAAEPAAGIPARTWLDGIKAKAAGR